MLLAVLAGVFAIAGASTGLAQEKKYRFVFVSHIGSNDPNMKWLTLSLEEFERRYPEVETEYISTNEYSVQKHVQMIEQALATEPDGLAVPIASSEAMEPVLTKAIERGIPVIAFNIPDLRSEEERIPYLTYVGGDEYETGLKLGKYAIRQAKAGKLPQPMKVVCAIHDAAHQGLQARCRGMSDAMKPENVEVENLFISADPARARNILQAYLSKNKDEVNYVFNVASWSSPWTWSVAKDLGLDPDVDDKGVTILTVDASPIALEGIRLGHVLATHSQGFWLQGYLPAEWLYFYNHLGYTPPPTILTGPIVVHKDNIDGWIKLVKTVFGDAYETQSQGQW
jgi:simple sugar transport system substrate-binding protein